MPQTKQAVKALRKSKKKSEYNLKIKEDLKTLIKKTKQAIDAKEAKEKLEDLLKKVQKSIDKAVQKGIIKKNTGSRKLSRLVKYHQQGGNSKTSTSKDKPTDSLKQEKKVEEAAENSANKEVNKTE